MKNKQWCLASRPHGEVSADNFILKEAELDAANLQEGEILVRNLAFSIAPTMRNWINEPEASYGRCTNIGDVIRGIAAYEVIASKNKEWTEGVRLMGLSSWQEYMIFTPDNEIAPVIEIPPEMSASDAMGIFGYNSLTAYFGLINIAQAKPGETLVVSGAVGSVGSIVAQIGKIIGCRVIGIAGSSSKCDWLVNACSIDAVINYKTEDVGHRLSELCPEGVDVFFDNVGGDILQAVIDNIARGGRIALCGQISAYDSGQPAPGPRDMMQIVYSSVKMQGFLVGDFKDEIPSAQKQLMQWVEEGKLIHKEDIREGFENLPTVFMDLFKGNNFGSLILITGDQRAT